MKIICPNCNCELNLNISLEMEQKRIYMTRLEMAEEEIKPLKERQWNIVGYDADKDRFRVRKIER